MTSMFKVMKAVVSVVKVSNLSDVVAELHDDFRVKFGALCVRDSSRTVVRHVDSFHYFVSDMFCFLGDRLDHFSLGRRNL